MQGRCEGCAKRFGVLRLQYVAHSAMSSSSTVRVKVLFLFLFEFQAGGECLADDGAEGYVVVAEGVVGDGVERAEVHLAVMGKDSVVD